MDLTPLDTLSLLLSAPRAEQNRVFAFFAHVHLLVRVCQGGGGCLRFGLSGMLMLGLSVGGKGAGLISTCASCGFRRRLRRVERCGREELLHRPLSRARRHPPSLPQYLLVVERSLYVVRLLRV